MNDYFSKDIDGNSEDQVDQGLAMLRKITKHVASACVDDFALGEITEAPDSILKVQTVTSVCVALMDLCLSSNATGSEEWSQQLMKIYDLYVQFESSLRESSSKGKGKVKGKGKKEKEKDAAHEDPAAPAVKKAAFEMCTLSFQNVAQLLSFLCNDSPKKGAVNDLLSSNDGLHLWVLESAVRDCRLLRIHGQVEGLSTESIIKYCGILGRALMLSCSKRAAPCSERQSAVYTGSLECLNELLQAACKHYPGQLLRLLSSLDGQPRAKLSLENQLVKTLEQFQQMLDHLLSSGHSDAIVAKSSLALLGSLAILSDQLDPGGKTFSDLLERTKKLCKDVECSDATTVKALIAFLVQLNMTSLSVPIVILQLAQQVRFTIGDLNTTMPTDPDRFATVNEDTSAAVLSVVTAAVDHLLQAVEWALPRIADKESSTVAIEKSIYTRVTLVVNTLSELVQTAFSPGANSELVLKTATAFYTSASHVAKRQGKAILPQLERLIRAIAVQLTVKVYTFINHIESNEDNGRKRKRGPSDGVSVLKRTRAIPSLIFALEQYSQAVLALSTRTKVDLSFGFKPGTSRDFRIKDDLVNVRSFLFFTISTRFHWFCSPFFSLR